jgi:hypothetical protein
MDVVAAIVVAEYAKFDPDVNAPTPPITSTAPLVIVPTAVISEIVKGRLPIICVPAVVAIDVAPASLPDM